MTITSPISASRMARAASCTDAVPGRDTGLGVISSRICCAIRYSFYWGRGLGLRDVGQRCGVCTRARWRRCRPRVGLARRRTLAEEIIARGALAYHPCPPHWGSPSTAALWSHCIERVERHTGTEMAIDRSLPLSDKQGLSARDLICCT